MRFKERIKSFQYAFQGLWHLVRTETNAQIHLLAITVVTIGGVYFHITRQDWIHLVLCFGVVLSFEAMNTALERLTDLVSPTYHPLAGHAKDLAAGAVLWSAICSVIIGVLIFWPYIVP